ncbi:glycosyltransferase family 4 protein [Sporosarcina limicola]|uniref:Glycosyltransferase involved in cell wall biosynthesis n=1 Tax=Sporosarcina limicola TaxID=34101 RepID=A0A927MLZ0_9BACL|nr:glycosyltransferase family 4 protein [Sporosarcina limicola]MBE1556416.1 glycosyltransferase involved in cell wall biosynthesis [Sporosarcina limicola]
MNILLVTLAYPENEAQTNLYTDLMSEFKKNGHDVTVVCQREKRNNKPTELISHCSIPVLRVRTGNVTKTNRIEKGISTLQLEYKFLKAIKKHFVNKKFDLVLYSTPPITFEKVIKYFKDTQNVTTYLLLKDIFPQNAVDIGLVKENSIIHKYFEKKEKSLYDISDFIGCMSEANKQYLLKHHPEIDERKVEVNPNTIVPTVIITDTSKGDIRESLNIPHEALLFIYGGNLGKPQGIDFLIKSLNLYKNQDDVYFLIVGSGTEYNRIQQYIGSNKPTNIRLESYMPKDQYDELVRAADIGMIYLDKRFTIPNIPSRLTAYMNNSKPVLAVTDVNTDLKEIIKEANCGYYTPAGDEQLFKKTVEIIKKERSNLLNLGDNGRKYLESNFHVSISYEIIMKHFDR